MDSHIEKNANYISYEERISSEKYTKRFYERLSYNWAIFPLTVAISFVALYRVSTWTGLYDMVVQQGVLWTTDCTVIAIVHAPFLLSQLPPYSILWGLCLPMRPFAQADSTKKRVFRELKVCLVTKGTNVQTVLNSVKPWRFCKQSSSVSFHVILDSCEDRFKAKLPRFVNIVKVPASFQPDHAKYKGRALEWCRQLWKLSDQDWVLHLDEETEIDEYLVNACLNFIERGTEQVGMSGFLTTAEVFRVAEDFGRFQLPLRLFKRPLLGWMHGSFILINGAVENTVTWDTDCLAEDFWFAFQAARRGFKFGWIHAIAREQPPISVHDLIQQRRRWYTGIMSIDSWLVKSALVIPMMGPLVYACL
ncbi:uncharacterized protein N7529_006911 [Penicillium soppii]|uniref:uncharacterized protein n=1 Tax=Penicillium soppii TaxID=69789 RepID=UPI0025467868|nr:uncharacterized protein N7529_006911 [Penicillium soppii]KAJ5864995.1 hypothetical protein N7529_006911 [Penicillium soppii]